MLNPDLVAQMIRLEHAHRLRDAERSRTVRGARRPSGRAEMMVLPFRRRVPVHRGCDADAA